MEKCTGNVLNNIKIQYVSMSEVDRKIADYILEQPQKVVNITTNLLASATNVSEGSIINFSKRLGFNGFTALKINIAQNIENFENYLFDDLAELDNAKSAMGKMIENAIAAFRTTYDALPSENIEQVAEILMNVKNRIEIYGVGSSLMVAQDAYYRLMRIGLPIYAVVDAHISSISASMLNEDCVAIGISHTGRSKETLRAMEIAKSRNAKTICITSYVDSPLSKLCDITIVVASNESALNKEATVSRLTQLLILDSLCSYILFRRREISIELMANAVDIIGEHRK